MTIVENTATGQRPGLGQAKPNVRVDLPDGVEYQTGDHLTVMADNPPEVVDTVFGTTRHRPRTAAVDQSSAQLTAAHRARPRGQRARTAHALRRIAEAGDPQPITQSRGVQQQSCGAPAARRTGRGAQTRCPLSVLECLDEYPACALTGAELLELLEPMVPRHYSIASSSMLSPARWRLVVSVLDAPARSGHGLFKGVASNYLATVATRTGDPGAGGPGPPGVPGRCRSRPRT